MNSSMNDEGGASDNDDDGDSSNGDGGGYDNDECISYFSVTLIKTPRPPSRLFFNCFNKTQWPKKLIKESI